MEYTYVTHIIQMLKLCLFSHIRLYHATVISQIPGFST